MSSKKQITTRIAPSPTGYMHVGTARTALFNWLYARSHGGRFLLRIEDTDRARSTPEATQAILDSMAWLGLDHDGEAVSQAARAPRHTEVAHEMLASGHAYKCFATQDEIATFRAATRAEKRSTLYRSPWRDTAPESLPDAPYVIRLKAPRSGETVIDDQVQGRVVIQNNQLDDMICLRSDGTPTYMLAVVVDDFDMGVSHVIRGDDHLSNAARQILVYQAMGWPLPVYAHIPLIHGADGKKLSKRHGALGVGEYREMGYPAAAMRNYLARLGWSHGNDEFFNDQQALAWFELSGIGKSPARFDFKKLDSISSKHISAMSDAELVREVVGFLAITGAPPLQVQKKVALEKAAYCLRSGAKKIGQVIDKAQFILANRPLDMDEKSARHLNNVSRGILNELTPQLQNVRWDRDTLESVLNALAAAHSLSFGKLAAPLRAALAGRSATPSVFDMMLVLGRDETIARLEEAGNAEPDTAA